MTLDAVLARMDDTLPEATERLLALLRIPSISTDPAYRGDCVGAAEWLANELQSLGFQATCRPTPGHPMVIAHARGTAAGAGRPLPFYGYCDVQPGDPLTLWHRDPFDPAIAMTPDGPVVRARGVSDDKGQLMTFVEACRAWKHVYGTLPGRLTIFLDGEEESGPPSLVPYMKQNADALKVFTGACAAGPAPRPG